MTSTQERDAFGMAVSSNGDWSTPFQYGGSQGYQTDDTGLQLLGHRYYDASTGRFLTRDPIKDGPNWYAYCLNDPVSYADPNGLDLTVIGDTSGLDHWNWAAEGLFGTGGPTLRQPSKEDLLEALIEEPDGSEVMIWGHGSEGSISMGSWSLTTEDIEYVQGQRSKRGKGKLGRVWLRSCNTCLSMDWVNAWLGVADNVHGFTTGTVDGPIQHWDKPVTENPRPRPWCPWGPDKKEDKKKKKKGKAG